MKFSEKRLHRTIRGGWSSPVLRAAFSGGGAYTGYGTVFEYSTAGLESLLHSFDGNDGGTPTNTPIDSDGVLYSTTFSGGAGSGRVVELTVFELTPQGGGFLPSKGRAQICESDVPAASLEMTESMRHCRFNQMGFCSNLPLHLLKRVLTID
jgi:hypothetical protein